jgi:hypothetical protein
MFPVTSMAYSDREVFRALQNLIQQHGENAIISQSMVAEESGSPLVTVKKSLHRLETSGRIRREFTVGIGYKYRICDGRAAQRE